MSAEVEIAEALAQADADGRWMIRRVEGEDMGESVWVTNGELLDQANDRLRAVEAERDEAIRHLRAVLDTVAFSDPLSDEPSLVGARAFLAVLEGGGNE